MSVSLIKTAPAAFLLTLLAGGGVWAQTAAPLALPPSAAAEEAQQPVIISAPDGAAGLALPPAAVTPPVSPPPVETTVLSDVKPDSIGLLTNTDEGLGAGLWKGTSRSYVERFLPMLSLPSPFAPLNDLARRFLLTTAGVPEGAAGKGQSLTAMRVDKLVALGAANDAWKLANLAGFDQVDDISLRQAAEVALVGSAASDVCAKLPDIVKKHTSIEWQKLMLVCQLQAKDTKAAQVSLDLLHAQDVHDDSFFTLAEKNIIGGSKQLPRQLTPLKPLTLALLRQTDFPVRGEVYAHPDAALIAELLKTKASDDGARLALAERAAAKGIIGPAELANVYRSQNFSADSLANANISGERGPLLRALLYQGALQEKNAKTRVEEAVKFLGSLDSGTVVGAVPLLMGEALGDVQPATGYNAESASIAHIYLLAGKTNNAVTWLAAAHKAARGMPQVAAELQNLWPLVPLAGLESDKDFAADLDTWLDATLKAADPQSVDARAQKAEASAVLLLLEAAGFSVNEGAWAKPAESAAYEKIYVPPALVLERLRAAATANLKGDAILMGLLATTGGKDDPPLLATIETIRALRLVGLASDAGNLAKDAALRVLAAAARP